jgi:hypothetical protein
MIMNVIADISLNGFGAFIVVAATVITIGLGAVGIFMQKRSAAIINAMKEEREIAERKRITEREEDQRIISEQNAKLVRLEAENAHLGAEVRDLRELVTQAANVEALRGEVQSGFKEVLARLPVAS